ncbi:hypothetical protein [Amycolatopsis sp. YIM 10]|uniref:hypothetical protein n=1 Tax=Amycolatopsis sp. YIM 10 TaxID=2653857 RepID=UPI0012904BF7|nr:hypothetical protein [Amycolatopsis sp. YIM 10]QFU93761.1 hypothetical protein YIM_43130 [Amycolatopsis sp. YIM 10]
MRKLTIGLLGATALVLSTVGTAAAAPAPGGSVLGSAEIELTDPYSVFEFSVHARGDGRSGQGVVWLAHRDDQQIGWMVARVDCVRVTGSLGVVTGVVSDAQDFAVAAPGDPIALTVRDGATDSVSFASREEARKCGRSTAQPHEITRGDFRVTR